MKKITLFLLVFMLFSSTISISAQDMQKEIQYKEIAFSVLPRFLNAAGISNDTIFISNSFAVKNHDGSNAVLFLVLTSEQCVGALLITEDFSFNLTVSFWELGNEAFDRWIISGRALSFYVDNQILMVQSSNEKIAIGIEAAEIEQVSEDENGYSLKVPQFTRFVLPQEKMPTRDVGLQEHLSVNIVANDTVTVFSGGTSVSYGLCWAACCAMVFNYRLGNNYSASDVFWGVQNNYGGLPTGTFEDISNAFVWKGLSVSDNARLSAITLYNVLHSGKPVIFSIFQHTSSFIGHMVVLRGVEIDDYGTALFSFADPNHTAGYKYVVEYDINGGTITYPFNSVTNYYDWRRTYY